MTISLFVWGFLSSDSLVCLFFVEAVISLSVHFIFNSTLFWKTSIHLSDTLAPPVTFWVTLLQEFQTPAMSVAFLCIAVFLPELSWKESLHISGAQRELIIKRIFFFNFLFKSGLTVTVNCCSSAQGYNL